MIPARMGDLAAQDVEPPEENYAVTPVFLGGENAQTANRPALAQAKTMQAQGFSPQEIWDRTGWQQFPTDQRWRFEGPDTGVTFDYGRVVAPTFAERFAGGVGYQIPAIASRQETLPLGSVLGHPALNAAYPDLPNVRIGRTDRPGMRGAYTPQTNVMRMAVGMTEGGTGPDDPRTVLMHELTHLIQNKEGFARGGLPGQGNIRTYDDYRRLAGEVEARNMANRGRFPARMAPSQTQDVPFDEQIAPNYNPARVVPKQRR